MEPPDLIKAKKRKNWAYNLVSGVLDYDGYGVQPPQANIENIQNEIAAELEGRSAELRRIQASDSVWYTFSDGTPVSIDAVEQMTGGDAKQRLARLEADIDKHVRLAKIRLYGPQSPDDLQLMFDVIEFGVDPDPELEDLVKWAAVAQNHPNSFAIQPDTIIRGPFSIPKAIDRHVNRRNLLPKKDGLKGKTQGFYNVWKAFNSKLDRASAHPAFFNVD